MCDVIPLENDRGAKYSLQPRLLGCQSTQPMQLSLLGSQDEFTVEARLHLYLKGPGTETVSLCFQDK